MAFDFKFYSDISKSNFFLHQALIDLNSFVFCLNRWGNLYIFQQISCDTSHRTSLKVIIVKYIDHTTELETQYLKIIGIKKPAHEHFSRDILWTKKCFSDLFTDFFLQRFNDRMSNALIWLNCCFVVVCDLII